MDRATARQAVKTVLQNSGLFQATYAHEVKDFKRVSPVAMVHSDGSILAERGDDPYRHALIVSIWIRRSTDGEDTENAIDDLTPQVIDALLSSANLYGLIPDDTFTRMNYPVVDGVMYRREQIRVII